MGGFFLLSISVMFWTDWNRDGPKIEKANMDGSDRKLLVDSNLGLPNGLTLDFTSGQICWTDAGKGFGPSPE